VVLHGDRGVGVRWVGAAGVGHELHARGDGGVDRRLVLLHTNAEHAGADQQQPLHPFEGRSKRRGVVEVAEPNVGSALAEVCDRLGAAGDEDDVGGLLEKGLGGQAAQLAGGTGDGDGHARKRIRDSYE